jgi:hypothetical protein
MAAGFAGVITVPTTLTVAASTSNAPATAATSRTALGAIKTISPQEEWWTFRLP